MHPFSSYPMDRQTNKQANKQTNKTNKICKRCSFEWDMGKYSTRPMNKVWAFRRTPYSLDMCCIFHYRTKNEHRLYFLTRSGHTWHYCHRLQSDVQLECDMGWYQGWGQIYLIKYKYDVVEFFSNTNTKLWKIWNTNTVFQIQIQFTWKFPL